MTLKRKQKTQDTQNNKKSKAFHYAPSPSYIWIIHRPPHHPPTSPHSMCCARLPGTLLGYMWNIHQPPPTACAVPDSLVYSVPSLIITKFCFLTTMAHTNLHVEGLGASPCVNKIHFPPDCAECCWVPRYQPRKVHCCEAMCARILQYILLW